MLRADNTSAIVIALEESNLSQDVLHHEEVLLDLSKGSQCLPSSVSRADTPLLQVKSYIQRNISHLSLCVAFC